MFTELTEEEKNLVAPELIGHTDKTLVKFDNKYWYVKKLRPPEHKKPDYLGWLVGKDIANVAEVRTLSPEELSQLVTLPTLSPIGSTISNENTYLIRLVNSYTDDEILLKTNDEATAYELVYSVWIRRRDAHAFNKVYRKDVPIFFDHQTAFLGEPHLQNIQIFFQEPPNDYGCAGAWRVVLREKEILTNDGRNNPIMQAAQFIHNIDAFNEGVRAATEKILTIRIDDLAETIHSAGYNETEAAERIQFLKNNQVSLQEDIEMMKKILFKPFQIWNWV